MLLPAAVVLARAVAAVPIGDLVRLLVALVGLVGGARGLARPAPVVVLLREASVGRRVAAVAFDLARLADARAAPGLFLVGVLSGVLGRERNDDELEHCYNLRARENVSGSRDGAARARFRAGGELALNSKAVLNTITYPRAPARESR